MTEPGDVTNVAKDSNVWVQAGVVHGGVHFTLPPGASAEEKFELGVRFLKSNVPSKAWKLINEAVDGGYRTNRSSFYWRLALVSGRTWNELSREETDLLRNRKNLTDLTGDDAWADGVRTIDRLLDSVQRPEADPQVLWKEFRELGGEQGDLVERHLQLFLDGPLRDQMWGRALERANRDQKAGGRQDRVWKFFHPDPAPPRGRPTRPPEVSSALRLWSWAATAVFALTVVDIGYLLAQASRVPALLAYLLCLPAGYLVAHDGVEWRHRTVRRRAKDQEFRTPPRHRNSAPPGGFASRVDRDFRRYFAKYAPDGIERHIWLAETAGLRRTMRDELVEVYREQRIGAEKITWLIRHRVADVRTRWEKDTLWSHQWELATPLATRVRAVLGLVVLSAGGVWAVGGAVSAAPPHAAYATVLMLAGGWVAAQGRLHISLERRRAAADEAEKEQRRRREQDAFERWRQKLANRPDDAQMAAWLDCDRKVLLEEALRHYRLAMSDVVAYAFIETPAPSTERARERRGPWRYRGYRLLLFILTADGVREVTVRLDFERGTFHDRHRANYRYEAVAAVRVRHNDDDERTFDLALMNGQQVSVQVTGPGMEEPPEGETTAEVSEVTLDASGLHHTLHVLEGIAAEGKTWFSRER
ncbi:hypothetical protein [Actinoallomurus acaciae]|uniref:DUF2207 domain-containing protein n=1 Tax=Actinoallomurus acaciae TaxID=502577 RepID=A0ABV5YRV9_9ACTN